MDYLMDKAECQNDKMSFERAKNKSSDFTLTVIPYECKALSKNQMNWTKQNLKLKPIL